MGTLYYRQRWLLPSIADKWKELTSERSSRKRKSAVLLNDMLSITDEWKVVTVLGGQSEWWSLFCRLSVTRVMRKQQLYLATNISYQEKFVLMRISCTLTGLLIRFKHWTLSSLPAFPEVCLHSTPASCSRDSSFPCCPSFKARSEAIVLVRRTSVVHWTRLLFTALPGFGTNI
jgi:hypothetical protein